MKLLVEELHLCLPHVHPSTHLSEGFFRCFFLFCLLLMYKVAGCSWTSAGNVRAKRLVHGGGIRSSRERKCSLGEKENDTPKRYVLAPFSHVLRFQKVLSITREACVRGARFLPCEMIQLCARCNEYEWCVAEGDISSNSALRLQQLAHEQNCQPFLKSKDHIYV